MWRLAARSLSRGFNGARQVSSSAVRFQEAEMAVSEKSKEEFLQKFKAVVSSAVNPPHFPLDFIPKEEKKAVTGVPDKLTFNFYLPHEEISKGAQVDLVLVPAQTGDFGVMPGHVPTVAELRPGVVAIHNEMDKDVEKYFVSSGFAFVHADSSADVVAVDAFKLDAFDPEAVRAGLQEYTAKLAAVQAKGDDQEIAVAQIGVEVYSALNSALGH